MFILKSTTSDRDIRKSNFGMSDLVVEKNRQSIVMVEKQVPLHFSHNLIKNL